MLKRLVVTPFLALALLGTPFWAGCDTNEGPVEEAAESIDEAAEEVKDEVDDATTQ